LHRRTLIVLLGILLLAMPIAPNILHGGTVPCPQQGGGLLNAVIPTVSACPGVVTNGPLAAFTYDSCMVHGCAVLGFPVSFNATWSVSTNGAIVLYTWNFGDGSPQVQTTNPTTAYNYMSGCPGASNSCNVTLTVKDFAGMTDTIVQKLTLLIVPQFTFQPMSPRVGQLVTFQSSTVQGYCTAANNFSFSWSLGDDTTASGAVVSHVYNKAGFYRVVTTCYNSSGSSQVSETFHAASSPGPLAAFTYDSCEDLPTPCMVPGFPANFNASFSSSPNGPIVLYMWNFGDPSSSSNQFNSTNPSAAHDYLSYQNGSAPWNVTLTVEDSSGLFATISQMVSPEVYPKFTFQPLSPSSGDTVIFNGSATSFSGLIGSPSNTTKGYSWNFGDGTSGSGALVSHVFSATGLYRIVLTVSTAYGLGEASKTVSVGADPPAAPSVGGGGGDGRPPFRV